MISGSREVPIKQYLQIDRSGEGFGYTYPKADEEFWGVPGQNPYIEHRRKSDGAILVSVNCADVSVITFDV